MPHSVAGVPDQRATPPWGTETCELTAYAVSVARAQNSIALMRYAEHALRFMSILLGGQSRLEGSAQGCPRVSVMVRPAAGEVGTCAYEAQEVVQAGVGGAPED